MSKGKVINGVKDTNVAGSQAAIVMDCSSQRYFKATAPTATNPTCTVQFLPPGESAWLEFTQDADGSQTITFGSGGVITNQTVNAPQASNKTPAAGAAAVTVFQFVGSAPDMTTVEIVSKFS